MNLTGTLTNAEPELRNSAAEPVVRVQNLRHLYGDRAALDDVSFDVRPAEIFGLLGPNGSGKTTMFRVLSTLMLPTSGSASIMGYGAAKSPDAVRRQIGVVFQAPSIDVKLTAEENLVHVAHLYGIRGKAQRARVYEMLERVALYDRRNDRVETFSGGMQRRLELAKGLLHHPSVLLLDEPTTGLDPGARIDLWRYLQELRDQEGVSIIVTTHLMEEAEKCDRLAILSHGKLVGLGTPSEMKAEIGGDVLSVTPRDSNAAPTLADRIRNRFGVEAAVVDASIHIEREQGHRFITDLVEAFPGEIESVSLSKPTLEDVFISRTGHRFWNEDLAAQAERAAAGKKKKH